MGAATLHYPAGHSNDIAPCESKKERISPPASSWTALCYPLVNEISNEVDSYFLSLWPFPDERAKAKFRKAKFSEVTCLYFPLARDDRIAHACRLLTVLFLIDDLLEEMTLDEGQRYNEGLMDFCRGYIKPGDSAAPAEIILYDLWQEMRDQDLVLADNILEPTFIFMRAQTDRARIGMQGLGKYLSYREKDVGKALLSTLMQYSMGLHLSPEKLSRLEPFERNCARHISVVNDIYSWEKEYKVAQNSSTEGAVLCSAVQVLSDESNIEIEGTKRVLWVMVREWENTHDRLVEQSKASNLSSQEMLYVKGLEYQMSGNEQWSKTTLRYHAIG